LNPKDRPAGYLAVLSHGNPTPRRVPGCHQQEMIERNLGKGRFKASALFNHLSRLGNVLFTFSLRFQLTEHYKSHTSQSRAKSVLSHAFSPKITVHEQRHQNKTCPTTDLHPHIQ
jgi:hypothetical protein